MSILGFINEKTKTKNLSRLHVRWVSPVAGVLTDSCVSCLLFLYTSALCPVFGLLISWFVFLSVHLNIFFFTPSCAYITLQHVSSLGAHFICLKIIIRAAPECIVHFECNCKWVSSALVCVRSTCIWEHFGIIIRQHGASYNIYITLMSADLLFYCQEGRYVSVSTSAVV